MISSNNKKTQSQITFRIVGVLLVLCGIVTTSLGFTLRPVRPFPFLVKPKMDAATKLEQFFSKQGRKDLMLPVLMHGLKRYLNGAQNLNQFDRVIQDNIRKFQVKRTSIESMVQNWDALKPEYKQQWFVKEFINLDAKYALDLKSFSRSAMAAAAQLGLPKSGIPLPRKLPAGIVNPPQITEVRTAGLDFVLVLRPGAEFTLIGRNFSAVAAENRIQIGRVRAGTGTVDLEVLHSLTPTSATTTQLRGIAPLDLAPGDYDVRVITNRSRSNMWRAYVDTPPAPRARLDSIFPAECQLPGQRVLLRGENFVPESVIQLEFIDADVTGTDDIRAGYRDIRVGPPMVDFRNANEIFFTIPQETWPGDYTLSVVNPGAPASLNVTFNVCTPSYRVELESIFCRDESDWESPGDDEVAIVTHGSTDSGAFEADSTTREFEGFSDRTRQPSTGTFTGVNLFSRSGDSVPVKHSMALTYMFLETEGWDREAREDAIRTIGFLGGVADAVAGVILGIAAAGAATISLVTGGVAIVVGLVILAVWLSRNAPDMIGGQVDVFTAQQLQTRTTSVGGMRLMSRTASFSNDDDIGSYDMTYRIVRTR